MSVILSCHARRRALGAVVGLALATVCPAWPISVVAQTPSAAIIKAGDLVISAPSVRQPPKGARVAGGFMKITNTGTIPDRLVDGSAGFAKRFEVHEMAMDGGVMKMRELPKGLEIKPGETVELKPGGFHLMFLDVTNAPTPGTSAKVKLRFERAGEIEIDMFVTPAAAAVPGDHKH